MDFLKTHPQISIKYVKYKIYGFAIFKSAKNQLSFVKKVFSGNIISLSFHKFKLSRTKKSDLWYFHKFSAGGIDGTNLQRTVSLGLGGGKEMTRTGKVYSFNLLPSIWNYDHDALSCIHTTSCMLLIHPFNLFLRYTHCPFRLDMILYSIRKTREYQLYRRANNQIWKERGKEEEKSHSSSWWVRHEQKVSLFSKASTW